MAWAHRVELETVLPHRSVVDQSDRGVGSAILKTRGLEQHRANPRAVRAFSVEAFNRGPRDLFLQLPIVVGQRDGVRESV